MPLSGRARVRNRHGACAAHRDGQCRGACTAIPVRCGVGERVGGRRARCQAAGVVCHIAVRARAAECQVAIGAGDGSANTTHRCTRSGLDVGHRQGVAARIVGQHACCRCQCGPLKDSACVRSHRHGGTGCLLGGQQGIQVGQKAVISRCTDAGLPHRVIRLVTWHHGQKPQPPQIAGVAAVAPEVDGLGHIATGLVMTRQRTRQTEGACLRGAIDVLEAAFERERTGDVIALQLESTQRGRGRCRRGKRNRAGVEVGNRDVGLARVRSKARCGAAAAVGVVELVTMAEVHRGCGQLTIPPGAAQVHALHIDGAGVCLKLPVAMEVGCTSDVG